MNNNRHSPTFTSNTGAKSSIDITFCTQSLSHILNDWSVLDTYSHSDHNYISFTIREKPEKVLYKSTVKYKTSSADWTSLNDSFIHLIPEFESQLSDINSK